MDYLLLSGASLLEELLLPLSLQLGQFVDDRECSRLRTLVAHYPPAQVRGERACVQVCMCACVQVCMCACVQVCLCVCLLVHKCAQIMKMLCAHTLDCECGVLLCSMLHTHTRQLCTTGHHHLVPYTVHTLAFS